MKFGELLVKTVPLAVYMDMRQHFLEMYQRALEIPEVDSAMDWDNPCLQTQAIAEWEKSPKFDPHEGFHEAVETVQEVKKLFTRIADLMLIAFFISSIGIFAAVQDILSGFAESIQSAAVLVFLPAVIAAIARLYIYLLATNRDAVQSLNQELRIGPSRIQAASRNRSKLFGYYVWNSSLSGTRMHTVFGLLLFIRYLSEDFYDSILTSITENLPMFAKYDSRASLFRALYSKLRPQTWNHQEG